jgi:hypothetical protein
MNARCGAELEELRAGLLGDEGEGREEPQGGVEEEMEEDGRQDAASKA